MQTSLELDIREIAVARKVLKGERIIASNDVIILGTGIFEDGVRADAKLYGAYPTPYFSIEFFNGSNKLGSCSLDTNSIVGTCTIYVGEKNYSLSIEELDNLS